MGCEFKNRSDHIKSAYQEIHEHRCSLAHSLQQPLSIADEERK
jgi:hypothetical protein